MRAASVGRMAGWKSVEEIAAYVIAVELRDDIGRLTQAGPAAKDFKFRDQIRDSAASATKNLSEGFDRYYHGEFAYLAGVAKGSLGETIDALKEGKAKNYFSLQDFDRLFALAEKARKATAGLIRYLQSSEAPGECRAKRRTKRRRK
jgi:four helix bundle protein